MTQADISFVTVRRQFDFRTIEVGRWVGASSLLHFGR